MTETSTPILSIGIPTYNFGSFLGETLDAFLIHLPEDVEIVVVDGASTDDTATVVRERQKRSTAIRYVQLGERGGIDADIARTVAEARADYIWLFSADDVPHRGAVSKVVKLLSDRPDVLIVGHAGCTVDMRPVYHRYPIIDSPALTATICDPATRDEYLGRAVTSEAFFSFLSGLVIRRETWDAVDLPDRYFYGSCWAHAARLLAAMTQRPMTIKVHPTALVNRRGDNDSFMTRGIVARYSIAIEGWPRIFKAVFGPDAPELTHLRRVLRNEFRFRSFLRARLNDDLSSDQARWLLAQFDSLYRGSTKGMILRPVLHYVPRPVIGLLFRMKSVFNKLIFK